MSKLAEAATGSSRKTVATVVSDVFQKAISVAAVLLWTFTVVPLLIVSIVGSAGVLPTQLREDSHSLAQLIMHRMENSFWNSFMPPCVIQALRSLTAADCEHYLEKERNNEQWSTEKEAVPAPDVADSSATANVQTYSNKTQRDNNLRKRKQADSQSSTSDIGWKATASTRVEGLPARRQQQRTPEGSPPSQRAIEEAMPKSPSPSMEELQHLISHANRFNKGFKHRFASSQERLNEMS